MSRFVRGPIDPGLCLACIVADLVSLSLFYFFVLSGSSVLPVLHALSTRTNSNRGGTREEAGGS